MKVNDIKTPNEYILEQSQDRREYLKNLRVIINKNLPKGFIEIIQYGMIGYVVPHDLYPEGYHCNSLEPLPFMHLANQKNYIVVYHMGIYTDKNLLNWFKTEYTNLNIGKLNMGKSCIRFKKFEQIPYNLIGKLCSKLTVTDYIKLYESVRKK